jgi:hypothetical protein
MTPGTRTRTVRFRAAASGANGDPQHRGARIDAVLRRWGRTVCFGGLVVDNRS